MKVWKPRHPAVPDAEVELVPGAVYVLRSLRYPGVHKVGRTAWGSDLRAAQLARVKGYRGFAPFQLIYEVYCLDSVAAEGKAHARLHRNRIRLRCGSRELFRVPGEMACRAVDEACAEAEDARRLRVLLEDQMFQDDQPPALAEPSGSRMSAIMIYSMCALLATASILWLF